MRASPVPHAISYAVFIVVGFLLPWFGPRELTQNLTVGSAGTAALFALLSAWFVWPANRNNFAWAGELATAEFWSTHGGVHAGAAFFVNAIHYSKYHEFLF